MIPFFLFFHSNGFTSNNQNNGENDHESDKKENGDWAYITFQNGVPTVQDIKTNVGPVSAKEPVGVIVSNNGVGAAGVKPVPRPVKMISHQMPPQAQAAVQWQSQNKRISGDFSMFAPPPPSQNGRGASSRQATPMTNGHSHQQVRNFLYHMSIFKEEYSFLFKSSLT